MKRKVRAELSTTSVLGSRMGKESMYEGNRKTGGGINQWEARADTGGSLHAVPNYRRRLGVETGTTFCAQPSQKISTGQTRGMDVLMGKWEPLGSSGTTTIAL